MLLTGIFYRRYNSGRLLQQQDCDRKDHQSSQTQHLRRRRDGPGLVPLPPERWESCATISLNSNATACCRLQCSQLEDASNKKKKTTTTANIKERKGHMFGKSLSSFAPSSMIYVSRCAGVVVDSGWPRRRTVEWQ